MRPRYYLVGIGAIVAIASVLVAGKAALGGSSPEGSSLDAVPPAIQETALLRANAECVDGSYQLYSASVTTVAEFRKEEPGNAAYFEETADDQPVYAIFLSGSCSVQPEGSVTSGSSSGGSSDSTAEGGSGTLTFLGARVLVSADGRVLTIYQAGGIPGANGAFGGAFDG